MAINEGQSDILIGAYSVRGWDGAICMSVTPERSDFFMLEAFSASFSTYYEMAH